MHETRKPRSRNTQTHLNVYYQPASRNIESASLVKTRHQDICQLCAVVAMRLAHFGTLLVRCCTKYWPSKVRCNHAQVVVQVEKREARAWDGNAAESATWAQADGRSADHMLVGGPYAGRQTIC